MLDSHLMASNVPALTVHAHLHTALSPSDNRLSPTIQPGPSDPPRLDAVFKTGVTSMQIHNSRFALVALAALAALGFAGTASAKAKKPKSVPVPIVSISASSAAITPGDSVTLTWTSTNTRSCVAGGAWQGSRATSGSATISGISQSSNFYLQCIGTKGGLAEATAWVAIRAIDVAAVGDWAGYIDIPGSGRQPITAIIASDGRINAFANGGRINYWGVLKSAGSRLTGGLYAAVPPGQRLLSDGSTSSIGNFQATFVSQSTLSGTLSLIEGPNESSVAMTLYKNPAPSRPSSLPAVAGTYTDRFNPGRDSLTISSNGEVFYQNPTTGCVANGAVALVDPAFNVYSTMVKYSSCVGANASLNGTEFYGLATLISHETPEQLVFGLHGIVGDSAYADLHYYQRY
jgi:hypothetical protein